jgi:hypothetical protein
MAEQFIEHTEQWNIEPELVRQFMGSTMDIEHLIEELDRVCTARSTLELLGQHTEVLARVDKVRAEVEWFVQHAAERVVASEARLMWGSVLSAAEECELTLVTTNYDRAIELAANSEKISLDDGFETFGENEAGTWQGFGRTVGRLVKLHGSTDWYSDATSGRPIKLRHPMPLFGRARLGLAGGAQLGSALVLPSREKLLTRQPYPRLSQAFLNATDNCDLAIFVGSSLRDTHVRSAAEAMAARRVPVFVVSPRGDSYGVSGVTVIAQQASMFLVSTFPNALVGKDTIEVLREASLVPSSTRVLSAVKDALDRNITPARRRAALEELDDTGVALVPKLMQMLLGDADSTVARYALGLIPRSSVRSKLLAMAEQSAHMSDPAYALDLGLLRELVAA